MVDRLVHSEANRLRIEAVEKCFGGTAGITLLIPGRVLVGEGILTKSCRKKFKKRQFFLFNDIMVYGNILINKKKYNKQHIIPLEGVTLENLEDMSSESKNGWLIKTPHKSFAVYAATSTEKTEWMAHINKCIDELLKRTGKTPSETYAAVWVPDADSKVCMHCKKTQFTLLKRRHHCRNCGHIVCSDCSSRKELISGSNKPVRVCDTCFSLLSQRRLSGVVPPPPIPCLITRDSLPSVIVENVESEPQEEAQTTGYDSVTLRNPNNGVRLRDGAETSDSDDDDYNDSSDGLNQAAAAISLEDQKPTFYSEVTEAVEDMMDKKEEEGQGDTEAKAKTDSLEKPGSNGTATVTAETNE